MKKYSKEFCLKMDKIIKQKLAKEEPLTREEWYYEFRDHPEISIEWDRCQFVIDLAKAWL